MSGSQVSTSVTIIDSLHGYQALSLTEYNTSAACSIASGSVVEIAGAFFTFLADEPINASSWTSVLTATTAYIQLTPSGTAGSQIVSASYTATAPAWRDDFQGWYASVGSNIRVVGSVYKAEATQYNNKLILSNVQDEYKTPYICIVSSGSFIAPSNTLYITGIAPGGSGGSGGGSVGTGGGMVGGSGGGGGGGGAVCFNYKLTTTRGTLIPVTTNASGISILTLTLAKGSNGGNGGASGGAVGTAGAGGIGISNTKTGEAGIVGGLWSSTTGGAGGTGAFSYRSNSVSGASQKAPSWQNGDAGTSTTEYGCGGSGGGGGSGGSGTGSSSGGAGGSGGAGFIIVEW